MKSLLDIQQDIRKLEKNVQKITDSIKSINSDIEIMRNSSGGVEIDFSKIEIFAKQLPFGQHPLSGVNDENICKVYLQMLLNIVRLDADKENIINRMTFIQWLQMQSGIKESLGDLYKDCFKIDKNVYYQLPNEIPEKYREYFIVDALIVANIVGMANCEIHEYIANIMTIFELNVDDIYNLAIISKVVLCQRIEGIDKKQLKGLKKDIIEKIEYYICDNRKDETIKEIIKELRTVVIEIKDSDVVDFKWKVKQKQKVNVGDVIAVYKKEKQHRGYLYSKDYKTIEIKATLSGALFYFKENSTYYGVIANEKDNKDSIKAWIKSRR